MANKTLFGSIVGKFIPSVDATNEAGGVAYKLSPKAALAQYAATGCLNSTFYASADDQLAAVLGLARHDKVPPEFVARVAVYARASGKMKDMPALLAAVLSVRSPGLLAEVFDRVIDDAKMLRTFVQIMRSGAVGRKSLGTLPKRLVQAWFDGRSDEQVFRASVGNDPSLADVIRMVHPKPKTASRVALYGYLIGRPYNASELPAIVRECEAFKADAANAARAVPDVPFQMLTSLALTKAHWKAIARNAPWQMTRMNLNTFARHGVYDDEMLTRLIAERLRDEAAITRSRVFPYQLMVAFEQAQAKVPTIVKDALQDAMEVATRNVPNFGGSVYVCTDVSGSMRSAVTGRRKGSTSAVRCVDVAALMAACVLRTNGDAEVVAFDHDVVNVDLNARDSVMTNAAKLAAVGGGGTNCSAPLALLNRRRAKGELVIFVSDNESWVDRATGRGTQTMHEWAIFKARNPAAKLVCIDLQPYATTQASDAGRDDVLNIGGLGDAVFEVIAEFAKGNLGGHGAHWVNVIEKVSL